MIVSCISHFSQVLLSSFARHFIRCKWCHLLMCLRLMEPRLGKQLNTTPLRATSNCGQTLGSFCRVVLEADPLTCQPDRSTRSSFVWAYLSCVHCTPVCQSRPVIRRRIHSLTLLSAYLSTFHLKLPNTL